MKSVVKTLRDHFDYVVFDSPPAAPVTDPAVLGALVDGTVIVLQMGSTDRHAVLRTKEVLENVRAKLIGVILNNTTSAHTGYARYRYYQYYPYPSQESVWRRRLGYKTGLFLIGAVSAVAVTLGWFYWAMRSTPVSDSDREDIVVMEPGPPAEQAPGTSEESPSGERGESEGPLEEQEEPTFALSEEVPAEDEEPVIDESPSRPEVVPTPSPEQQIADIRVLFEKGKANVKSEYYDELKAVATALKKGPEIKVEIRGYTDDSEAGDEKLVLSQNRAAAVAARLTKAHGVELRRLSFMGYGPANPVGDNSTPEGRALNRRVEFTIQNEQ
jgi:outer membrane protein OmpA-like peptidoglycan-associated protein